jgi:heme a synthase
MQKKYSSWFIRLNWFTLIVIFLVIIAGSFVRITGSGMGCPDWPKCFGQWVPPTTDVNLPENYKAIYSEKRAKKIEKFSKLLDAIGLKSTSNKIRTDKSLLIEQDFNARKTWTEYVNRLFGFFAGNGVLLIFAWILFRYRTKKLIFLGGLNLIILIFQAWFGSIVVATNLVPWTITVHLFFALVIIVLQLLILLEISKNQQRKIKLSRLLKWIIVVSFMITFIQMFLGTQVREYIDVLTKQGFGRDTWTNKLGLIFYIHRSFSWFVFGLLTIAFILNFKTIKERIINLIYLTLIMELVSGILLAHADMPGLVQTAHLLFACIIFALLFVLMMRFDNSSQLTDLQTELN